MSNQTGSELVVTEKPLWKLMNTQEVVKEFELACGREAGSVMIAVINAANNNPELWECEPQTVITAALNSVAVNLSLAPALGQACILPFKKFKNVNGKWIVESKRASFVPMLRGIKAMAMRTGEYLILNAFKLYEGQEWVEDQMTGLGHIKGDPASKDVKGYGAYLKLLNGFEATMYKTSKEVMSHAERYSPAWNKAEKKFSSGSRWITDFDDQGLKTVMKALINHKGVISDKDRAVLEKLEAESEWDQQTFKAGEDTVDGEANEVDAPMPAELHIPKELEIPWNMTDKNGNKFGELPDDEILIRIQTYEELGNKLSEDGGAKLSALRQIRDYRKSLLDTAKDLGGEPA